MSQLSPSPFKIGNWYVEPDHGRMTAGGMSAQLEPKSMEVLVYLAQRQGQVIESEQIIEHVWHGRPMSDNPVYKCIAKLRKALGDDPDNPSYIHTFQKRGYKLIQPVDWDPPPSKSRLTAHNVSRMSGAVWLALGLIAGLVITFALTRPGAQHEVSLTLLSHFPGSHSQPDFSPDGSSVVFVSQNNGKSQLFSLALGTNRLKALTAGQERDTYPKWSPSGRHILFNRQHNIWVLSLKEMQSKLLISNAENASWSYNGNKIVFERRFSIWTADADGGNQQNVEGLAKAHNLLSPRLPNFSPDGQLIAYFQAEDNPMGDLWIIPAQGGKPQRITHSLAFGGSPIWTPDQQNLIYSSSREGSRTLWKVPLNGEPPIAILTSSGDDTQPAIARDGRRIIYTNSRNRFILTATHLDTGESRDIYESRAALVAPELSPDHSQIAFFNRATIGGMQIFTLPVEGGTPILVTHDPNALNAIPQWSADGQRIYYYQTAEVNSFRVTTPGQDKSAIVAKNWQWNIQNATRVHPNETSLIYSRMDSGAPVETLIRDLTSGHDQVFPKTLEWPRWTSSGKNLVAGVFEEQRTFGDIAYCQLTPPDCRILAEKAHIPTLSHDESRIFYVREEGDFQSLWSIDTEGKEQETFHLRMGPLYHPGPFYAVTKQNEVIWVKFEKTRNELWMVGVN